MLMAQDPNSLIDSIKAIPDLVWGGIIGVVGIIIGTLLSWIPVFLQLRHDSKEKCLTLLRDTYLSAVEKIGQEINYLASFYTGYDDQPQGYIEALSKLNILCTGETIKVVHTFNDYLIKAMFVLIPLKDRINNLEGENKNRYNLLQEVGKRAGKAINDMEEHNLQFAQGTTDNTKWPLLISHYESAMNSRSRLINEYEISSDEIIKLTYELAEKCHQIAQEAEELEIPIIKAIRKELSFPFDEQAYREMIEISNRKWNENMQEYITSKIELYKETTNKLESIKEPPEPQS